MTIIVILGVLLVILFGISSLRYLNSPPECTHKYLDGTSAYKLIIDTKVDIYEFRGSRLPAKVKYIKGYECQLCKNIKKQVLNI